MNISIKINIHKELFERDPEESNIGQEIISKSILLIDNMGLDKFTLKKLAIAINSNEPSIYRYFSSKHQLLMYLISWYWSWLEYKIDGKIHNIKNPTQTLKLLIKVLCESVDYDPNFAHIREDILARIVTKESSKAYITSEISQEEKNVIYHSFFSVCKKIAGVIRSVNSKYQNPEAFAASLIRITHEQIFLAKNFPDFTGMKSTEIDSSGILSFVEDIAFSVLKK